MISEEEWGRLIGELGPLLGIMMITIRVLLTWRLAKASYRRMLRGDPLGWMLLSFGLLVLAEGGWAQPTGLGFCVIIGGLVLASVKHQTFQTPT